MLGGSAHGNAPGHAKKRSAPGRAGYVLVGGPWSVVPARSSARIMLSTSHARGGLRIGRSHMSELPRWASRGFKTGVALSLQIPVATTLVAAFPDLKFGYPLVLLPLLAVGPVATRGLRSPRALLA